MNKKQAIKYLEKRGKITNKKKIEDRKIFSKEEIENYSELEREKIKNAMKRGRIFGDPIVELE